MHNKRTYPAAVMCFNEDHHVVGLALLDFGLQGLDLELGLLQLADTLTGCTLILVELALLLFNKTLEKVKTSEFNLIKSIHNIF